MFEVVIMIIKFMTFNIQHCQDYVKKVIDIDLMVNTIKQCQADIIGLNEVYDNNEDNPSQAEIIANKLGFYYYFGQAIVYNGRPYGNAMISKYKFTSVETIKIPDPIRNTNGMYETRCIIKANFESPDFTVLISHFGLVQSEQINAVSSIASMIKEIKTPTILMGDFNMEPEDNTLTPIFDLLIDTLNEKLLSFPSINPVRKIDYILISKEIKVIDASIPSIVASDHLPHLATLNIK